MQPSAVVEDLDVFEDGVVQLEARRPAPTVDELVLERCEEGLDDGVVPAVAFATHADGDTQLGQRLAVLRARVLATAVGMVEQPARRATPAYGGVECGQWEPGRER